MPAHCPIFNAFLRAIRVTVRRASCSMFAVSIRVRCNRLFDDLKALTRQTPVTSNFCFCSDLLLWKAGIRRPPRHFRSDVCGGRPGTNAVSSWGGILRGGAFPQAEESFLDVCGLILTFRASTSNWAKSTSASAGQTMRLNN